MPRADLLIRNIGELVTFAKGPLPGLRARDPGEAVILRGSAVAVRDNRIVAVGQEAVNRYSGRVEVDAGGRLVSPGFVDAHTHAVYAGSREDELELKLLGYSYEEILARGGGIYRTVEATRRAGVEELARLLADRLRLMARLGSTVVEVKTGYGLLPEYELALLEAIGRAEREPGTPRVAATLLAHVPPRDYPGGADAYVRMFADTLIPMAVESARRPEYVDVFCDRGVFNVEQSRLILEAGLRHGLRARLHADQLAYIGCSRLAGELPIDSLDHLERTPEKNTVIIARSGATATLLPASIMATFTDSKPPVEALRRNGAIIAVASDYNPNNPMPSMQTALDLAVYTLGLTPLEALAAATVNAAYSLRLHEQHGRIVPGAWGDLLVWDLESYKQVAYYWGYDRIALVAARGRIVEDKLSGTLGA